MGLDMFLTRQYTPKDENKMIIMKLSDKDEFEEVAYWRKCWEVQTAIGDIIGENIENCEYYVITKEQIEELLKWAYSGEGWGLPNGKVEEIMNRSEKELTEEEKQDIHIYQIRLTITQLKKILAETDFENYTIKYHGWW